MKAEAELKTVSFESGAGFLSTIEFNENLYEETVKVSELLQELKEREESAFPEFADVLQELEGIDLREK